MKHDAGLRLLFFILMGAAGLSFALCLFSDIRMSAAHSEVASGLAVGLSWLIGHGLHGGVVVLLPVAYVLWQRSLFPTEESR